jgi:hypothetical protein
VGDSSERAGFDPELLDNALPPLSWIEDLEDDGRMARFKASCPDCGEIALTARDVAVLVEGNI